MIHFMYFKKLKFLVPLSIFKNACSQVSDRCPLGYLFSNGHLLEADIFLRNVQKIVILRVQIVGWAFIRAWAFIRDFTVSETVLQRGYLQ